MSSSKNNTTTEELKPSIIVFDPLSDIAKFHEKFNMAYSGIPRQLPPGAKLGEEEGYRIKFEREEQLEYENACMNRDVVKQFDALIDKLYITLGTLYLHGFPVAEGWAKVHAANMSKELGSIGQGKFGGGVIKGKDFVPPDEELRKLLEDRGWINIKSK